VGATAQILLHPGALQVGRNCRSGRKKNREIHFYLETKPPRTGIRGGAHPRGALIRAAQKKGKNSKGQVTAMKKAKKIQKKTTKQHTFKPPTALQNLKNHHTTPKNSTLA